MRNILLACVIAFLCGCVSNQQPHSWQNESIPELKTDIESKHPAAYYTLAAKLFNSDPPMKDEAVVWFYAGQIRFRYHLAANPNLDPSGDPALFASLSEVVGRQINEYAGSDADLWISSIDKALAWDESHKNTFTSKEKTPDTYKEVRDGLEKMKQYIDSNREMIKETRKQTGLD